MEHIISKLPSVYNLSGDYICKKVGNSFNLSGDYISKRVGNSDIQKKTRKICVARIYLMPNPSL